MGMPSKKKTGKSKKFLPRTIEALKRAEVFRNPDPKFRTTLPTRDNLSSILKVALALSKDISPLNKFRKKRKK